MNNKTLDAFEIAHKIVERYNNKTLALDHIYTFKGIFKGYIELAAGVHCKDKMRLFLNATEYSAMREDVDNLHNEELQSQFKLINDTNLYLSFFTI